MSDNIKKILIRGVNWVGDSVLTTPAIKAVHEAFPDAYICLLVKPWVADIFKENPNINEIILYDEKFNSIPGKLKLARMLRARGFNSAILLQNAFDAALITWLSGIPERIGYRRDLRSPLLTTAVPVKKDILKQHQVYYYLNLLKESLNIEARDKEPFLYLNKEEINEAKNLLNQSLDLTSETPLIGVNPGATYGSAKRWMPERFAELISRIINEFNGKVVIFGSRSEAEIAKEITKTVNNQSTGNPPLPPFSKGGIRGILNMAGKTNLRQLSALISECDVMISNDSGPMHIASALLVPVVAVFGSTDRTITGPFGEGHKTISKDIPCSPCLERECPEGHVKCMTDIATDDVFSELQQILPKEKAVFLDRDGTLNEDVGYLNSFSNLKIFDGARKNLQRLKKAGFRLIGVTNQSGIARGLISEEFVTAVNSYMQKKLGIDDFYFCPHHPDNGCQCRKPRHMMLRKARLKHGINLKTSYVVGDKDLDMLLARSAGARGILVLTGIDKESEHADFTAKDLTEAVGWILKQERA